MEKVVTYFIFLACLLFASCDKNKEKVEKMTTQFIDAVNAQDKAAVYDMYPGFQAKQVLNLPKRMVDGEIKVTRDDKSGTYIASIDNPREQKIEFKVEGDDRIKILDTYNVMQLDFANSELALKTGVPVKKMTDMTIATLFKPAGDFFNYLYARFSDVINGDVVAEKYSWQAQGGWYPSVTCYVPIRNNSEAPIMANEYNVEVTYYTPSGYAASTSEVQPGVDLQPGEAHTYILYPGGAYYQYCMMEDFKISIRIQYKNQNPKKMLLRYAKFSGDEFEDFLKKQAKKRKLASSTSHGKNDEK